MFLNIKTILDCLCVRGVKRNAYHIYILFFIYVNIGRLKKNILPNTIFDVLSLYSINVNNKKINK